MSASTVRRAAARPSVATFYVLASLAVVVTLTTLTAYGLGELGLRAAIRNTARLAAGVFAVTYGASAVAATLHTPWSRWLLRNRRLLGLSFALVMFVHLSLILALAIQYSAAFWSSVAISSVVGGSIGYGLLTAMCVTSFPGPAARVGRRNWRRLHTVGMHLNWFILTASYAGLATQAIWHLVLVVPLLGVFGLRSTVWVRRLVRRRDHRRCAETAAVQQSILASALAGHQSCEPPQDTKQRITV